MGMGAGAFGIGVQPTGVRALDNKEQGQLRPQTTDGANPFRASMQTTGQRRLDRCNPQVHPPTQTQTRATNTGSVTRTLRSRVQEQRVVPGSDAGGRCFLGSRLAPARRRCRSRPRLRRQESFSHGWIIRAAQQAVALAVIILFLLDSSILSSIDCQWFWAHGVQARIVVWRDRVTIVAADTWESRQSASGLRRADYRVLWL
ncbi:hypothetical protein C8F01DRAFT_1172229 [Mycena amicta]|nr:hypothetical protein C8F01DRAFT_1172229 [Mycena amicta]